MQPLLLLKQSIKELIADKSFIHHEWFLNYHIEIVERIALELCDSYHPEADKELVLSLVWFHDYGKIIDFPNEHEATQERGLAKLLDLGFDAEFAKKVVDGIALIDKKDALSESSIEIQITSSSDGASHLIGPFYSLFWREHPNMEIEHILLENNRKLEVDWQKKITLPEVRSAMESRYTSLKEQFGNFPERFLKQTEK